MQWLMRRDFKEFSRQRELPDDDARVARIVEKVGDSVARFAGTPPRPGKGLGL